MFYYGIEHEVAFLGPDGKFADFTNTRYSDFDQIIARLPVYADDYPQLRIGDAGIKKKRWYIEGFERFLDSEDVVECVPKGIEIRTSVHTEIAGVLKELRESFDLLQETAAEFGYTPALVSFNPFQKEFEPRPPLNEYERERRRASPEKGTAEIPMMTQGPDLNISGDGLSTEQIIDAGKKWTYYSPYMLPFSYSSPFFQGGLWGEGEAWRGYSIRTYVRTGRRPAAMVFLVDKRDLIKSSPSLTKLARVEREAGRIEFKAFDSCGDFTLYAALLALLKGLLLDERLAGRALVPDAKLHQLSAQLGF